MLSEKSKRLYLVNEARLKRTLTNAAGRPCVNSTASEPHVQNAEGNKTPSGGGEISSKERGVKTNIEPAKGNLRAKLRSEKAHNPLDESEKTFSSQKISFRGQSFDSNLEENQSFDNSDKMYKTSWVN